MLIVAQLGERNPPGPTWQQTTDMSTRIGSLLPSERLSTFDWQLLPGLSTHIGSLLPVGVSREEYLESLKV